MLAAESYKMRMETGLSFIEFNYMLLQAYDFWWLYTHNDCTLQMGGNDQWGNILAGVDLIRRLEQGSAYALTFPLITTASGQKMGKTHAGAIWLDPQLTSPYDYYQYWINTDDPDVERFLALFTFLPMEEVRRYGKLQGADLRKAKEVLAFEATKITHGEEEARAAQDAARALFGSGRGAVEGVPTSTISASELEEGIPAFRLFARVSLAGSNSEARRLITQGGGYVNDHRLTKFDELITVEHIVEGAILLRGGKKNYHRIEVLR
jgi:tyrosyl-tRNA synthetase